MPARWTRRARTSRIRPGSTPRSRSSRSTATSASSRTTCRRRSRTSRTRRCWRVQAEQRRGDGRARRLQDVPAEGPAAEVERRVRVRRRDVREGARGATRWSSCRSTGCCRSPRRIGRRTRTRSRRPRSRSTRRSPPTRCWRLLQHDHPAPRQLLKTTQDTLDSLRQFIVDHHIVTIPAVRSGAASRRRRRSCARRPRRRWTRRARSRRRSSKASTT